jgi:hypothetical protein
MGVSKRRRCGRGFAGGASVSQRRLRRSVRDGSEERHLAFRALPWEHCSLQCWMSFRTTLYTSMPVAITYIKCRAGTEMGHRGRCFRGVSTVRVLIFFDFREGAAKQNGCRIESSTCMTLSTLVDLITSRLYSHYSRSPYLQLRYSHLLGLFALEPQYQSEQREIWQHNKYVLYTPYSAKTELIKSRRRQWRRHIPYSHSDCHAQERSSLLLSHIPGVHHTWLILKPKFDEAKKKNAGDAEKHTGRHLGRRWWR